MTLTTPSQVWIMESAARSANLDPGAQRNLRQTACPAKEALTDASSVDVSYGSWSAPLTRDAFDALIEPMVARSLKACRRAVRDSGIELEEVGAVVMVGGSTRVPRVRDAVAEAFGRQPLTEIDPDQVVARSEERRVGKEKRYWRAQERLKRKSRTRARGGQHVETD